MFIDVSGKNPAISGGTVLGLFGLKELGGSYFFSNFFPHQNFNIFKKSRFSWQILFLKFSEAVKSESSMFQVPNLPGLNLNFGLQIDIQCPNHNPILWRWEELSFLFVKNVERSCCSTSVWKGILKSQDL